jgi:hypothetical protein
MFSFLKTMTVDKGRTGSGTTAAAAAAAAATAADGEVSQQPPPRQEQQQSRGQHGTVFVWVTQGRTDHMAVMYVGGSDTIIVDEETGEEHVKIKWSSTKQTEYVPKSSIREVEDTRRRRARPGSTGAAREEDDDDEEEEEPQPQQESRRTRASLSSSTTTTTTTTTAKQNKLTVKSSSRRRSSSNGEADREGTDQQEGQQEGHDDQNPSRRRGDDQIIILPPMADAATRRTTEEKDAARNDDLGPTSANTTTTTTTTTKKRPSSFPLELSIVHYELKDNPEFPSQLWKLLNDAQRLRIGHLFSWLEDGVTFRIHHKEQFFKTVLSNVSHYKKLLSFRQVLGKYHFHTTEYDGTGVSYRHITAMMMMMMSNNDDGGEEGTTTTGGNCDRNIDQRPILFHRNAAVEQVRQIKRRNPPPRSSNNNKNHGDNHENDDRVQVNSDDRRKRKSVQRDDHENEEEDGNTNASSPSSSSSSKKKARRELRKPNEVMRLAEQQAEYIQNIDRTRQRKPVERFSVERDLFGPNSGAMTKQAATKPPPPPPLPATTTTTTTTTQPTTTTTTTIAASAASSKPMKVTFISNNQLKSCTAIRLSLKKKPSLPSAESSDESSAEAEEEEVEEEEEENNSIEHDPDDDEEEEVEGQHEIQEEKNESARRTEIKSKSFKKEEKGINRHKEREARRTADGCLLPIHTPLRLHDGTFVKPTGARPRNLVWDASRGLWAPPLKPRPSKVAALSQLSSTSISSSRPRRQSGSPAPSNKDVGIMNGSPHRLMNQNAGVDLDFTTKADADECSTNNQTATCERSMVIRISSKRNSPSSRPASSVPSFLMFQRRHHKYKARTKSNPTGIIGGENVHMKHINKSNWRKIKRLLNRRQYDEDWASINSHQHDEIDSSASLSSGESAIAVAMTLAPVIAAATTMSGIPEYAQVRETDPGDEDAKTLRSDEEKM